MKPVLFPFTYVTEPIIKACCNFFGGLSVFQASMKHVPEIIRQGVEQGLLDLISLDPAQSGDLDAILAETESWARYHGGGVASFLKGYQDKVPFFGTSSISKIKQDIQAAEQGLSHDAAQEDTLLRACVFLQMAQDFDIHNLGLIHQMQQQEVMEKNLFRELKGDEPSNHATADSQQPIKQDDPFEYMISDRLTAWSHVMLAHGHVQGPLVTTHASILALIQEQIPDTENLIWTASVPEIKRDSVTGKKEQQDLMDYCQGLIHTPGSQLTDSGLLDTYPTETAGKRSLNLYLVPGIAATQLMTRFVGGKIPVGNGVNDGISTRTNTLIGYIPSMTD